MGSGMFKPRSSSDIEMNPRSFPCKFAKQQCGSCCIGSSAIVLEIGNRTFDQFFVIVTDRHSPHPFTRRPCSGSNLCRPIIVIAKQTCVKVTQGNDDGTCKSCKIDDPRCP